MLAAGDQVDVTIEKPAAGGRMLARHEGRIVFVHGAIPGERVRAQVERVERQLAFASTVEVLDASPDRRDTEADLACGGCSYAHVAYPRQLRLKADVIHDAFARLGRHTLDPSLVVQPSPERGYRMRARFHVRAGRVGFFREGTHELCDPRQTGQLLAASVDAAAAAATAASAHAPLSAVELAENIAADERVVHLIAAGDASVAQPALDAALAAGGLTGCTAATGSGRLAAAGSGVVSDPLPALTLGRAGSGRLRRHAESFFQANRHLLPHLVAHVMDAVAPTGEIVDLYAGVGLFSVSLAQSGREGITAVEGDRSSARDLAANARACGAAIRVVTGSVEGYLPRHRQPAGTIVVDPPRTGISRAAIDAIIRVRARRLVYVSCDPPTMARDARRLLDAGYRLAGLRAFDLFPGTPHVEAVGIFDA